MLFSLFIILELIIAVKAWPCVSPIRNVYSRVNTDAVLQFNADLTNLNAPRKFEVKFYDGTIRARITYNTDKSSSVQTVSGVSVTADTSGNVAVTLNNVQENNDGIYILTCAGFSTRCNSLYLLGTPVKPTVTVNKTPSVGESVQLTCSSTSTTTPSNHSLSLRYDWKVNNNQISDGTKYTTNANKLTVNNIVQEDANKQFTCTATEDVTDGYTSTSSDQFSFDVYYGPDSLEFTPSDTSYEKVENDNLNQVTCKATCYPVCSFTWTKTESSTEASSSAILNLGRLQSSDAGTYRCTATRTGGYTKSKDLTVNVIYGPKNVFFNPSTVSYRLDENSKLAQVTCGADCWECNYSWTGPNSYTSSNAVLDLSPLTKAMAGTYKCTARNIKRSQLPLQAKQLTIEVRYGPDSIKLTNGQTVYIVDENTQLNDTKCEADCFPECTYRWTKDRQSVSNTGTLSLGRVEKSTAGNYVCKATNGDTPSKWKEKTVTIHIRWEDEFTFEMGGSCKDSIDLKISYTGSGHADMIALKFSKMKDPTRTLNILTSVCTPIAGADPNFPVSRMTFSCDNAAKIYTVTIKDFEESTDAGIWEATLSVDGSFTCFKNVNVGCSVTEVTEEQTTTVVTGAFDNTRQESNNTGLIVGVTLGVLLVAVTLYAIIITICFKRKLMLRETETQSSASKKQTTYANLSYRPEDPTEAYSRPSNETSAAAVGQDKNDSVQLYTDLVQYANADNRTYDVVQ